MKGGIWRAILGRSMTTSQFVELYNHDTLIFLVLSIAGPNTLFSN